MAGLNEVSTIGCDGPFDRFGTDTVIVHGGKLVHLDGWCSKCGALMTTRSTLIHPSPHPFAIVDQAQVLE